MRRTALLLLLLTAALAAAGCDGGSDDGPGAEPAATAEAGPAESEPATTEAAPEPAEPARLYTRAELPSLALQPADAPAGMRYTKAESGARTLFDVGIILDDQVAEARELGFRGAYDAIFDATGADLRLSSRVWLFAGAEGATRWLERTRDDAQLFQLAPVSAPPLADDSWAARGNVAGSEVVSHGFRAANVVVVVTLSSQSVQPSEPDALAAARTALDRVHAV